MVGPGTSGSVETGAPAAGEGLTVAVVAIGNPASSATWSGTPSGLVKGLRACGVKVLTVDVRPPCAVVEYGLRAVTRILRPLLGGRSWRMWRDTALYGDLATLTALARRGGFASADVVIQVGAQYRVRHPRVFTLEDMTVDQARRVEFGAWALHSCRTVSARNRRHRKTYQRVEGLLAATQWAATSMREDYGVAADKIHVVGLGGSPRMARSQTTRDKDWSTPCFLFVGHDWERKNGGLVVEAFQRVRVERPEAQLLLVGQHSKVEGPGIEDFGPLVLEDPHAQSLLAGLFARATCLVVPSRIEPAGLVYAEAGHAGIPAIGSDSGGAREMIGPGGTIVAAGDVEDLTRAMLRLADPDTARRLGVQGAGHAATLTWDKVAERVLAAISARPAGASRNPHEPAMLQPDALAWHRAPAAAPRSTP